MPGTISQPSVTVNVTPASQTVGNAAKRLLFIGQMATGTATAGSLVTNIGNAKEEDALFGAGSILAQMVRAAKSIQGITQMDAIPLADSGTAVKAAGSIAFSGTATAAGSYVISVGSRKGYQVTVSVAVGDTATTVGAALVAALDTAGAAPTGQNAAPYTYANATGTVTFTAVNGGTLGNDYGIELSGVIAGLTTTVTGFTSGANDPSLTSVLDPIAGVRYYGIVWQHNFATSVLVADLDAKLNMTNAVMDGRAFLTKTDTLSNIQTAANALNSSSIVMFANKVRNDTLYKGGDMFEFEDVISAQFAATRSLRMEPLANITAVVQAAGAGLDTIGGSALASLPYFNTPFANLPVIDLGKGFTDAEVETLGAAGASVIANNLPRTSVIAGEVVTTYKTDTAGNTDTTWKYLNYIDTATEAREFMFNNLKSDFSQTRLTTGSLVAGRKMENQASIFATISGYYSLLSGADYTLLQAGQLTFFEDNLSVSLDLAAGSVTVLAKMPIVTQLRTIIVTNQMTFTV